MVRMWYYKNYLCTPKRGNCQLEAIHLLAWLRSNWETEIVYCQGVHSSLFSVTVIKHWPKPACGGKGLFPLQSVHQEGESGQELEARTGGRNRSRGQRGVLLSGLLPMGLSASFLHSLTTQGCNRLQWAGPPYQLLIKKMPHWPVHKTIW